MVRVSFLVPFKFFLHNIVYPMVKTEMQFTLPSAKCQQRLTEAHWLLFSFSHHLIRNSHHIHSSFTSHLLIVMCACTFFLNKFHSFYYFQLAKLRNNWLKNQFFRKITTKTASFHLELIRKDLLFNRYSDLINKLFYLKNS